MKFRLGISDASSCLLCLQILCLQRKTFPEYFPSIQYCFSQVLLFWIQLLFLFQLADASFRFCLIFVTYNLLDLRTWNHFLWCSFCMTTALNYSLMVTTVSFLCVTSTLFTIFLILLLPVVAEAGIVCCLFRCLCVKMRTGRTQGEGGGWAGSVMGHPGGLNLTAHLQISSKTFVTCASSLSMCFLLYCHLRQNTRKDHLITIYKRNQKSLRGRLQA